MKVAIDARAFWWTGVGRYIRNIASELLYQPSDTKYTLLVPYGSSEDVQREVGDSQGVFDYREVDPSYYSLSEQTVFLRQLRQLDADVVHFTHFNVPLLYRRPYVVTIHDITRFVFPGQKRQSLIQQIAYEQVFCHAISHARRVIAVSRTTADDIASLPIASCAPITTIYEGIDKQLSAPISPLSRQKARLLLGTDRPFLLFVGVWMSHKNLTRLLDAYRIVKQLHPEIALVITGKPVPGYANLLQYVQEYRLEKDIFFPGFVPHELLASLYSISRAFVFPSLYEGFGLPPLEAMACGVPVVASNVSSIPEVLGNAAEYVNPEHAGDIARGIRRVLESDSYANELIRRGSIQAAKYRWDAAAREHAAVYQEAG